MSSQDLPAQDIGPKDLTHPTSDVVEDPRHLDTASQGRLIWLSFRKHRLAMAGAAVVLFLFFVAVFVEFFAPFDPHEFNSTKIFHPPQMLKLVDNSDGGFAIRLHVNSMKIVRDPLTLQVSYEEDLDEKVYIRFFGRGDTYRLWNLFEMDIHFIAPVDPDQRFFLLGSDRLGRDVFSRTVFGTRLSMSIGLVGVAISLVIGIILGGISGYFGGIADAVIQRIIEVLIVLPSIPLWMGLSAAMPTDWSVVMRYFAITVILSLVGWTELARVVRGRFLSLRSEDFVTAARLDGSSRPRIIFRHILPSTYSYIVTAVSLAIPAMILAETALSFLGLGLLPPAISWGALLFEAQNIRSIVAGPWLFAPGFLVLIAVLAFNFLGDGLRDAADPYAALGE